MGESRAILLFKEHRDIVDACTDEQAGQLFKAIFAFACDGEELDTDDQIMKAFYSVFRNSIIRANDKYEETCRQNAENGRKGGLATAAKRQQMLANASDRLENVATASDRLANASEAKRGLAKPSESSESSEIEIEVKKEIEKETEKESEREIEKDSHCSELSSSSEPPEIVPDVPGIILNDGSDWYPTIEDVKGWEDLYPGVDVKREFAKMREWCINNPKKRKTKTGARKFVSTWLDREQNRVGSRQPQKDKYTQRIEDVDNWGSSFFDQMQDW